MTIKPRLCAGYRADKPQQAKPSDCSQAYCRVPNPRHHRPEPEMDRHELCQVRFGEAVLEDRLVQGSRRMDLVNGGLLGPLVAHLK